MPLLTAKDIALATLTPEQEARAQQGWCMKCAQPSLSEKHREGGMRWLQCSRCTTVYAIGVPELPELAEATPPLSANCRHCKTHEACRNIGCGRAQWIAASGVLGSATDQGEKA